jgi:hypothetical protein
MEEYVVMERIKETIVEPSRIYVGSLFKLKIKAIRYATYEELKTKLTYATLENYTYGQLKGE